MLAQLPATAAPGLPWAILLHDVAKPVTATRRTRPPVPFTFTAMKKTGALMAEALLKRLKFPRRQTDEIVAAVLQHMQFKDVKNMRKSTLRRMVMRETFPLEMELHRLDCLGSHRLLDHYDFLVEQARELEKQPEIRPPLLRGEDLKALGVKPGPRMGELLAEVREKQLQDELKTTAEALSWVAARLISR